MKKPEKLPSEYVACFNDFVNTANKHELFFKSLDVAVGEDTAGKEGLHFTIETSLGLTDDEARNIFSQFLDTYPACGISYNRRELSELEKSLYNVSSVVMEVHEGFRLETIK